MEIKDSILLPKTEFSMKADLPKKEPAILDSWQKNNLYESLRKDSKDKEKFILHDGPPYANGHLHMGHALNKILKDIIVKYQQLLRPTFLTSIKIFTEKKLKFFLIVK